MARLLDEYEDDETQPEQEAEEVADEIEAEKPEEDGEESDDASDETQAEDEGEGDDEDFVLVIDGETVGDDSDDADEDEADSSTIRKMRAKLREAAREKAELERQLRDAAAPQQAEDELGERPTLEAVDYDEERYAEQMASYLDRKKKADEKQAAEREKADRLEKAYQAKVASYEAGKKTLKAPDFDASEEAVKAAFSPIAQGVILSASKEPEKVVYALGKHGEIAKQLAALQDDPIALAAEIGRFEGRIGLQPRKPKTKPEARVKGSASTGKAGATKSLERAIDNDTGDLTAALKLYRARSG